MNEEISLLESISRKHDSLYKDNLSMYMDSNMVDSKLEMSQEKSFIKKDMNPDDVKEFWDKKPKKSVTDWSTKERKHKTLGLGEVNRLTSTFLIPRKQI